MAAFFVIATSFTVTTALRHLLKLHRYPRDFAALRVAATFPNIIALPILIFPSLCEYPVVHGGFAAGGTTKIH